MTACTQPASVQEQYTSHRIFGAETEYAIVAVGAKESDELHSVCNEIIQKATSTLQSLPSTHKGIFLRNGARLYKDSGAHLEYATPECTTPDEFVNHVRAGDAILQNLVDTLGNLVLLHSNVDYLTPSTWGQHESHLHQCADTDRLATQLIPHIISCQIYSGAGGFDPFSPELEFVLSPRTLFFHAERSESVLAMYSIREESLATNGDRRLHITPLESISSNAALWLRVAATSLIVRLIEADLLEHPETIQLENSVQACHTFTRDISLKVACKTITGKFVTALDIQRYYLEQAKKHIDHPIFPEWAAEACNSWEEMLNLLSHGPNSVSTICDWAIKLKAFNNYTLEHGKNLLKPISAEQRQRITQQNAEADHIPVILNFSDQLQSVNVQTVDSIDPLLRCNVCVLDQRFTEHRKGLFARVEHTLHHDIDSVTPETINSAKTTPPLETRAKTRGEFVAEFSGERDHFTMDWGSLIDKKMKRTISLKTTSEPTSWSESIDLSDMFDDVSQAYNAGDYSRTLKIASKAVTYAKEQSDRWIADRFYPYLLWVTARKGDSETAFRLLEESSTYRSRKDTILADITLMRFRGLTPTHESIWERIAEGEELFETDLSETNRVAFQLYKGHILMQANRFEEAEFAFCDSLKAVFTEARFKRLQAMSKCDLANCLRIRGEIDEAQVLLAEAHALFTEHGYLWELCDVWLPNAIKPGGDNAPSEDDMCEADECFEELDNPIGFIRALLLRLRGLEESSVDYDILPEIENLRDSVPDLRTCPLLAKILRNWDAWRANEPTEGEIDFYWGL